VSEQVEDSATWQQLMRFLADALDYPQVRDLKAHMDHLSAQTGGRAGVAATAQRPSESPTPRPPSIDAAARAERAFLTMCLSRADSGRVYLGRLEEDHFSSEGIRRVWRHLEAHFDDPLAELPEDPSQAALIKEVAMPSGDDEPSDEALRLQFLLLERRRVERSLRRADKEGDLATERSLQRTRQSLRSEIDELMGQTQ
jgi:hypothetical protein